ncbi:MAG: glycosyltransferase family 2 protein [Actinobacteria bacterium]|nr:glycosyltransferase family 2 protein [Actinomycetota bacterium]
MNELDFNIAYSIVVPVYNEVEVLPELYKRLTQVLNKLDGASEVIFVNDGSKDNSLTLLSELSEKDNRVKVISLSRNFGHQIAITTGIDYAKGQAVIIMDADLQDPPEIIPRLIEGWKNGYDIVYAVREKRKGESFFKKITASLFYKLIRKITNVDIPMDAGDFRLLSRRVVDRLKTFEERNRFVRGLISWMGYKQIGIRFKRDKRFAGKTKYPLRKMLKFAFDGITSFSFVPLQIATYFGFFISFCSFLYAFYVIAIKLLTNKLVPGWTSLIVTVLFLGGIQLITLGIVGEYIGRIYDEVKRRPLYLVAQEIGFDETKKPEVKTELVDGKVNL